MFVPSKSTRTPQSPSTLVCLSPLSTILILFWWASKSTKIFQCPASAQSIRLPPQSHSISSYTTPLYCLSITSPHHNDQDGSTPAAISSRSGTHSREGVRSIPRIRNSPERQVGWATLIRRFGHSLQLAAQTSACLGPKDPQDSFRKNLWDLLACQTRKPITSARISGSVARLSNGDHWHSAAKTEAELSLLQCSLQSAASEGRNHSLQYPGIGWSISCGRVARHSNDGIHPSQLRDILTTNALLFEGTAIGRQASRSWDCCSISC